MPFRALVATIVAVAAAAAPALVATPAAADHTTDVVHPIVFPVIGDVRYSDDFHAPRSGGRTHHATDLLGNKMQELVAADDGVVSYLTIPEASWGYMLTITADDGWKYSYIHINDDTPGTDDGQAELRHVFGPGIAKGSRVRAGQLVAFMGDSGNAEDTAPHLHFEMYDPSGTVVNPYHSLQRARRLQRPVAADDSDAAIADSPIARLAGAGRVGTSIEASKRGWPDGSPEVVLASGTHYAEALPASVLAAAKGAPLLLVTDKGWTSLLAAEVDRLGAAKVTVVGSVPGSVDGPAASGGRSVHRVGPAGDAVATSVAVARMLGAGGGVAVLVSSESFADGIAAAGLAAGRGWPVLLTSRDYVYQPTVDTWRALGVHTLHLTGGTAVIGKNIEDWARDGQGLTVHRHSGANRYGTSAAVIGAVTAAGGRSPASTLFATGRNHPDALASGALAARLGGYVALVDGAGIGDDSPVGRWVTDQRSAITSPAILGGPAAVGGTADDRLQSWLGL